MEQYLNRSIESLLNQTYRDIEIILVDDGSQDNSPQICDEWDCREKRIRVIHKTNGGISSARNCGIDNALGQFIIFPDPDDWVEPDYLEKLLALKYDNDADLSICERFHGDSKLDIYGKTVIMDMESALENLMSPVYYCGFAWNKLYELEVIRKNGLRFDEELGMAQDLHFNVRYFQLCNRIVYDSTPLYHYCTNTGGVTSGDTPLTQRKISGLLTYKRIAELMHDGFPKVEKMAYGSLCKLCLKYIITYYKFSMKNKEMLNTVKNTFVEYREYFYKCDIYTRKEKRFSKLIMIHPYCYYTADRIRWHCKHLLK